MEIFSCESLFTVRSHYDALVFSTVVFGRRDGRQSPHPWFVTPSSSFDEQG